MTPTAFEFTVTLPGDARFLEAIRLLAVQAAGYAGLSADQGTALAADVAREAQAALTASHHGQPSLELVFAGDEGGVSIRISGGGPPRHVRQPPPA